MRLFGRKVGATRKLEQARTAELRGDLPQACALFDQAGRLDEAARIMLLRGDGEADPGARLRHFVQALATAPAESPIHTEARRKRASLILALAGGGATPILKQDLLEAARDLEALGELERAAEAYARAGDVEGEARSLARAGDVDRLDALLLGQQGRDREALRRHEHTQEVATLLASGRRREAALVARASGDEALHERGRGIEQRRIADEVVVISLQGRDLKLVLGEEVPIGRVGPIAVASAAVSRQHVVMARRGGEVVVRDLGSRNGTTLRGLDLMGEATVGDCLELLLGNEVPLVVRPSADLPGAVAVEIAGERYVAPLGPARLGIGAWRLERGPDGWVELATDDDPPAFAGLVQLASRVTLLRADAIARARAGPVVLRLDG